MTTKPWTVLFLCTGNSARSLLAEATLNHPAIGGGRFRAYSAGSHPTGRPNPFALERLASQRIATDGLRSKSWDEFAAPGALPLDFIFTVCGNAAGETCPHWPGHPLTAHWGVPDPAAVKGGDAEKRQAFLQAYLALRQRIERLVALPLETLEPVALRKCLREIGEAG